MVSGPRMQHISSKKKKRLFNWTLFISFLFSPSSFCPTRAQWRHYGGWNRDAFDCKSHSHAFSGSRLLWNIWFLHLKPLTATRSHSTAVNVRTWRQLRASAFQISHRSYILPDCFLPQYRLIYLIPPINPFQVFVLTHLFSFSLVCFCLAFSTFCKSTEH